MDVEAGDAGREALDEEAPRSRPFWSGTISFGLVTIPVDFYAATRATRRALRMLSPSGNPVARRYFQDGGRALEASDLERGYELEDGTFVPVSDEELDALAPEQSRDIDLTRFVERADIPPLSFERAYVLAPSGGTNLAYRLLASTLEHQDKAGIASFVMRGTQHAVAIYGERGLLRAATLRLAEELRTPEAVGLPSPEPASPAEVQSLRRAIRAARTKRTLVHELRDHYWQRLEAVVEQKKKDGVDIVRPEPAAAEEEGGAEVIDLVSILRQSLSRGEHAARSSAQNEAPPSRAATNARGGERRKSAKSKATKSRSAASIRSRAPARASTDRARRRGHER